MGPCSFNQVDLQNMMDQTREKRSHQSKFVKQLSYYTIVFTLQISLTVVTLVETGAAGGTITMIDTKGFSHDLTSSIVFATLGIGWAAFGLSLLFNILYYALHPSQVDILNIRKKLVVAVVGYEINLVKFTMKDLRSEVEGGALVPADEKEFSTPQDTGDNLESVVTTSC